MSVRRVAAAALAAVAAGWAPPAAGQLADRVSGLGDGVASIRYDTRPGVEICDQGIRVGEHRVWWRSRGWDEVPSRCSYGPVDVELTVREGQVRDVDVVRGPRDRTPDAVDLGSVAPDEAVAYLLALARGGAARRAAEKAVFPMMLADVDEVWRDLMDLARDREVRREARKAALFWLGQEAADAATEGLAQVAGDEDEEQDIRDAAVFALSQRPGDEGVPILMELARTADEAKTRRSAMFWLAQSDDERVLAFFQEILLRRGPGN